VQEFVGQALRQMLEDLFRRLALGQQLHRMLHLVPTRAFSRIAQRANDRHRIARRQPAEEILHPVGNDRFGINHGGLP